MQWQPVLDEPRWAVRPVKDRQAERFDHWVAELVTARNEQERRQRSCGGVSDYLALIGTPAWDEPWRRDVDDDQ